MGESQEENAIVTSTGQFVVAWDFNKVKKGQLDKYHIKKWVIFFPDRTSLKADSVPSRYEDFVVQDNFKFGDDKEIVSRSSSVWSKQAYKYVTILQIVALQNNVLAVNKRHLQRPTRASLAPMDTHHSRSSIVNSPY
jgi:VID27 C-terminal WD40-like domain